jgi:hypothetical protein
MTDAPKRKPTWGARNEPRDKNAWRDIHAGRWSACKRNENAFKRSLLYAQFFC